MVKKVVTIKAFLKECDTDNKKLTMLFLDDEIERFTKNFLTNYYSNAQNNPIKGEEFYIKYCDKSRFFLDKVGVVIGDVQTLVDSIVIVQVHIRHYNFTDKSGRKVVGWSINMIQMKPA